MQNAVLVQPSYEREPDSMPVHVMWFGTNVSSVRRGQSRRAVPAQLRL